MISHYRRRFLTMLGAGAAVTSLSQFGSTTAIAADLPLVDVTSSQAKNLLYVANTEVDGQNCLNCSLYKAIGESDNGTCLLFRGNSVGADAWCKAWVAAN